MSLIALLAAMASAFPSPGPVYVDFHADYSMDVQGVITTDSTVVIKYDLLRATCPHASTHGGDTWTVSAYWAYNNDFNNIQVASIAYTPFPGAQQLYLQPSIVNPPQGDIAMWFVCGSEAGVSYDSNYGKNWHLTVQ